MTCALAAGLQVVLVGGGGAAHLPHRRGRGEDEPVEHAAAGRQHAGHAVGLVAVRMPTRSQAVAAHKPGAHQRRAALPRILCARHRGAQHGFHQGSPGLPWSSVAP